MEGFPLRSLVLFYLGSASPSGVPGLLGVVGAWLTLPFTSSSTAVINVLKIYDSSVASRRPLTFSAANWRRAGVNEVLIQSGAEAGHLLFFIKSHHVAHLLPLVTHGRLFTPAFCFNKRFCGDKQPRLDPSTVAPPTLTLFFSHPDGKSREGEHVVSSAKPPLPPFSLNERAINWRGDNVEKKGVMSLCACFPFAAL